MQKTNLKSFLFFCRAYNDFDTQLSLMTRLDEEGHDVNVIGIAADGDVFDPNSHEMANFIKVKTNIKMSSMFERFSAPIILKIIFRLSQYFRQLKVKNKSFFLKALHIATLIILRKLLKRPLPWLDHQVIALKPDFVIADEGLFQSGRSYFFDRIIPLLTANGAISLSIYTGQVLYKDLIDFGLLTKKNLINENAEVFFCP